MRAGPEIGVDNLCHELAHFVEIDEARSASQGWGFKYGETVSIPGHGTWQEFRKDQHIRREIRVWGIQYHLQRWIGKPVEPEELGVVGQYLPDYFRVLPEDLKSTDKEKVTAYFGKLIAEQADNYTANQIVAEIKRRRTQLPDYLNK